MRSSRIVFGIGLLVLATGLWLAWPYAVAAQGTTTVDLSLPATIPTLPASSASSLALEDTAIADSARVRAVSALRSSPVMFIENVGQFDERARLQVDGSSLTGRPVSVPLTGSADSPWPMYMHDALHSGLSPFAGPNSPVVAWTYRGDFPPRITHSLPVVGPSETVYLAREDLLGTGAYLIAVDSDGTEKWRVSIGDYVRSTPAVASNGSIYVASYYRPNTELAVSDVDLECYLQGFSSDGTALWMQPIGLESETTLLSWTYKRRSSPMVATDGTVAIVGPDGSLYAFGPDGSLQWIRQLQVAGFNRWQSPAISPEGTIYVNGSDGWGSRIWGYDLSGELSFRVPVPAGPHEIAIGPMGKLYYIHNTWSYDSVTGETVEVGSVYAIEGGAHTIFYSVDGEQFKTPLVIGPDGTIYVVSSQEAANAAGHFYLHAVSSTGTPKWTLDLGSCTYPDHMDYEIPSPPVMDGQGTVYLVSYDQDGLHLNVISSKGTVHQRLAHDLIDGIAIGGDGFIYAQGTNYTLSAFGPESVDTASPAAIADLSAGTGSDSGTVDLIWTAPGDDGDVGTASSYIIRRNNVAITDDNWDASIDVLGEPAPSAAGTSEAMTVSGLEPGLAYYFAIRAQDEVGNTSDLSNSPCATAGERPIPGLTASPSSLPADGFSTSTITLSGAPAGHQVRLISSRGSVDIFSPASGITDVGGQFVATVRSSTPDTTIITAEDLTTGQTFATSASVTFTPVDGEPPPPPSEPQALTITGIDADYALNGNFLTGFPPGWDLVNSVDVFVDWNGHPPGYMELLINDEVVCDAQAEGSGASCTLDMNQVLEAGRNVVEIIAHSSDGFTSQQLVYASTGIPPADWLQPLVEAGLAALKAGDHDATLAIEVTLPPDPYEARVDFGIHGYKSGIAPTQLFVRLEYELTEQDLALSGGLKGGVQMFDHVVKWRGEVGGEGSIDPTTGALDPGAIKGSLGAEYSGRIFRRSVLVLINAIPPLQPVYGAIQAAGLENWARRYALLYVDGKVSGVIEVRFQVLDGEMKLEYIAFHPAIGIEGGAMFYIKGGFELRLYVGAEGDMCIAYPPLAIDHIGLTGKAGIVFKALFFKMEMEGQLSWVYPEESQLLLMPERLDQKWHLIGHNDRPEYAAFRAPRGSLQAFAPPESGVRALGLLAPQTTVTSVLVSNVYTYPEPSLGVDASSDEALLVWVHDDIAKPVGQAHEIHYSLWDGGSWSTPTGVTDDNLLDGSPQVAWAGDGQGIAVWQRLTETLPISATWDITTAQKIEIATAVYSPTLGTWSPSALLTSNGALDFDPELVANESGQLLSVWRQNEAGLLGGTITDTDRIMAAFHDGGWGVPVVAVEGIPGLIDLAAGYGHDTALVAYTQHITPSGWPTPTLQLLTSEWDGVDWSAPLQRTDDSLGHRNPQIVYNGANQPLLVWLAGDELRLQNLSTSSVITLTLPAEIGGVDEFRTVQDHSGNIAVVFTAQTSQRDLYVAFYDQPHNLWGRPVALTEDRASEAYPAPALDSTGRLLMGYTATAIDAITRTTTISGTGEVVTYTMPTEGQTDLLTLSHVFTRNLTLGDGGLTVSDDHPAAGSSVVISATVRNSGDLALDGVTVAFYDGSPGAGGTLIGSSTLSSPLPAGFTATLATTYGVPITGGAHVLYAVADPDDLIAEADEGDNTASLAAFGPDLDLAGAGVDYWGGSQVAIVSLIRNAGTTASLTTTLEVYWEAITGTLALTDTVPVLGAGETITLTTPWDYGALGEGSYPLVASVNTNQADFAEVVTTNNQVELSLEVLPDLAVSPYYLWAERLPDGRVVVTGTLYNFGSVASDPVPVEVWLDEPFSDTHRLGAMTLPGLGPAGSTTFTATWDTPTPGQHDFYVGVDFGRTLTETTRVNNLASTSLDVVRMSLAGGWNLVSSPFVLGAPGSVFAPIAGKYGRVYAYDGCDAADPWKVYDPADPGSSDLAALDEKQGYWIEITEPVTLTVVGRAPISTTIPLCAGLNLIGYPSLTARAITDALSSCSDRITLVYTYDPEDAADPWKKYEAGAPDFVNDLAVMEPGKGYWIKATSDCTWTVEN